MTLRVLGCSGAIAAGCRTTSFLLDDAILLDAGTGVGELPLEQLAQIEHVLLSHSHLDHVLSIPLLADAVLRVRRAKGKGPIQVHALPETLEALRKHLLNDVIWPDFTRLPSAAEPALRLLPFAIGDRLTLGGRVVEVLSAAHTVPACGFAVRARHAERWIAYTGDTGPNPALWQRLNQLPLSHLIIEAAFGDDEAELAALSRHHCPASLVAELRHLEGRPQVWLTHIKPGETQAVMGQMAGRHGSSLGAQALQIGQRLALD